MEEGTAGYGIDLYTREDSSLTRRICPLWRRFCRPCLKTPGCGQPARPPGNWSSWAQPGWRWFSAEEFLNPQETDWETGFTVQYAYAIVVLMLCLFSSAYVVRAIAEEKSSRLVELLMVSVRPLALLLGKVLP